MRPSKPCSRSSSAALAPARLAPAMTNVCFISCPFGALGAHQFQELLAGAMVVADEALQGRGDGSRAGLLPAARERAEVRGPDPHADPPRRQLVGEPVGD